MILFFQKDRTIFAVKTGEQSQENISKLKWLFGNAKQIIGLRNGKTRYIGQK